MRGCSLIILKGKRALVIYMKEGRSDKENNKGIRGDIPLSEATGREHLLSRTIREISNEWGNRKLLLPAAEQEKRSRGKE